MARPVCTIPGGPPSGGQRHALHAALASPGTILQYNIDVTFRKRAKRPRLVTERPELGMTDTQGYYLFVDSALPYSVKAPAIPSEREFITYFSECQAMNKPVSVKSKDLFALRVRN